MLSPVAEDGPAPGDDLVGMPVSSVHSNRTPLGAGSTHSAARSTRSVESQGSTPGAFSVQSRAVGGAPAWRQRLRSQLSTFTGPSRRERTRRPPRRQQNPADGGDGGADDQSHLPPEMRRAGTSRLGQLFRTNARQSSRTSHAFPMFSVRLFGGDATVQTQEQASLPFHEDLDEGTFKRGLGAVICIGIVLIGVTVGVILAVTGGDKTDELAPSSTPQPAAAPTNLVILETPRFVTMRESLAHLSGGDADALVDPTSPQYEALLWLAGRDGAEIDESDAQRLEARYALATLYYATKGPRWNDRLEFLTDNHECEWSPDPVQPFRRGVSCNGDREVVSIFLDGIGLSGSIPVELVGLPSLQFLTISNNTEDGGDQGTLVGDDSLMNVAALSNLVALDLSMNLIDSTLPPSLARLSNLEILALGTNKLKFTIPEEFSLLTKLKLLDMSDNRLVGAPERTLRDLDNLESLLLGGNDLLISPDLDLPTTLTTLNLRDNSITNSPLTSNIARLSNLRSLNLISTGLAGTVPVEFGSLTLLETLHLGNNQLSGQFPWSILDGATLLDLNLVQCSFTGELPRDLGRFTALTTLGLIRNSFNGTIPESMGDMSSLIYMNFKSNEFVGTIPSSIGGMTSLYQFDVSDNMMHGSLPVEMSNMQSLALVNLLGNSFSGGSLDFVCSQTEYSISVECSQNIECECCECVEE